jgi:hypothetical protein
MARTFKITKGYGESAATFHLRMIRIFEEIAFGAQFAEFSKLEGEEKAEAETEAYVNAIAEWSVQNPTDREGNVLFGDDKPAGAVKEYFATLDPAEAERVANAVIFQYQRELQPDVVF